MIKPHYYEFEIIDRYGQTIDYVTIISDNDVKSHKMISNYIKQVYDPSIVEADGYEFVNDFWYGESKSKEYSIWGDILC